jgi:hypothetical protein
MSKNSGAIPSARAPAGSIEFTLTTPAQARRIKGFVAEILPSNQKMIRLARAAGDLIEQEDDEDGCEIKTTF